MKCYYYYRASKYLRLIRLLNFVKVIRVAKLLDASKKLQRVQTKINDMEEIEEAHKTKKHENSNLTTEKKSMEIAKISTLFKRFNTIEIKTKPMTVKTMQYPRKSAVETSKNFLAAAAEDSSKAILLNNNRNRFINMPSALEALNANRVKPSGGKCHQVVCSIENIRIQHIGILNAKDIKRQSSQERMIYANPLKLEMQEFLERNAIDINDLITKGDNLVVLDNLKTRDSKSNGGRFLLNFIKKKIEGVGEASLESKNENEDKENSIRVSKCKLPLRDAPMEPTSAKATGLSNVWNNQSRVERRLRDTLAVKPRLSELSKNGTSFTNNIIVIPQGIGNDNDSDGESIFPLMNGIASGKETSKAKDIIISKKSSISSDKDNDNEKSKKENSNISSSISRNSSLKDLKVKFVIPPKNQFPEMLPNEEFAAKKQKRRSLKDLYENDMKGTPNEKEEGNDNQENLESLLTSSLIHKLVIMVMLLLVALPIIDVEYISSFLFTDDQTPTLFRFCMNSLDKLFKESIENSHVLPGLSLIMMQCIHLNSDGTSSIENESNNINSNEMFPLFYIIDFTNYGIYNTVAVMYNGTSYSQFIPQMKYIHPRYEELVNSSREGKNYIKDAYYPEEGSNSTIEYVFDNNTSLFLDCLTDIFKAIFIAMILILGAYCFSKDIQSMVTLPLDKILAKVQFYLSNTDKYNEEINSKKNNNNSNMTTNHDNPVMEYKQALLLLDDHKKLSKTMLKSSKKMETYQLDKSIEQIMNLISISSGKQSKVYY